MGGWRVLHVRTFLLLSLLVQEGRLTYDDFDTDHVDDGWSGETLSRPKRDHLAADCLGVNPALPCMEPRIPGMFLPVESLDYFKELEFEPAYTDVPKQAYLHTFRPYVNTFDGLKDIYNYEVPFSIAPTNRTRLLLYFRNDTFQVFPPWSYMGSRYGAYLWHKIKWERWMWRKNRSFFMFRHKCIKPIYDKYIWRRMCWADEAPERDILPHCRAPKQSPQNLVPDYAFENIFLENYEYHNLAREPFQMRMTLAWDGTDSLVIDLVDTSMYPGTGLDDAERLSSYVVDPKLNKTSSFVSQTPWINNGSLRDQKMYLNSIYIHLGGNLTHGSEHRINGKPYAMEIQFVFTKWGNNPLMPFLEVMRRAYYFDQPLVGGTTHVISVLVEVVKNINMTRRTRWNQEAIKALVPLGELAKEFWASNNVYKFQEIPRADGKPPERIPYKYRSFRTNPNNRIYGRNILDLKKILPPYEKRGKRVVPSNYYTYRGSWTEPPCWPNISWSVYETPIVIPELLWGKFAYIHSEFSDTGYVGGNFRPLGAVIPEGLDSKDEFVRQAVIYMLDNITEDVTRSVDHPLIYADEAHRRLAVEEEIYDYVFEFPKQEEEAVTVKQSLTYGSLSSAGDLSFSWLVLVVFVCVHVIVL